MSTAQRSTKPDLIAFLNDRLAEKEATAKAAGMRFPGPWEQADNPGSPLPSAVTVYDSRDESVGVIRGSYAAAHIARHDPARALREVEATRVIIADHEASIRILGERMSYRSRQLVQAFAAVYSDHPGYRDEWKTP